MLALLQRIASQQQCSMDEDTERLFGGTEDGRGMNANRVFFSRCIERPKRARIRWISIPADLLCRGWGSVGGGGGAVI